MYIIFLSLTLSVSPSVRMSVCHGQTSNWFFFFFVSRWNRTIFGRLFSMWHSTKLFFFDFWFRPLTPKIYSPKFACRSLSQSYSLLFKVCTSTTFGLGVEFSRLPACLSACLYGCLSACRQDITQIYQRIFMKFLGGVGRDRRKSRLDFGGASYSFADPGWFF